LVSTKFKERIQIKRGSWYTCDDVLNIAGQATVQSAALPDEWASRAWAGELSATKPQAEQ